MDFRGPEPTDLADVRSINIAFLEYLSSSAGEAMRRGMTGSLRPVIAALTEWQIQRLAAVPFLLLTLNESDDAHWRRILDDQPVRDLFTATPEPLDPLGRIVAAALTFQWQLARRNLYAARLVGGASLRWCEQLASCSLLRVLQFAAEQQERAAPRLAAHKVFWTRLLGAGLSAADDVRRAAHLSAMQVMLASVSAGEDRGLRSAACYASVPVLERRAQRVVREDD
jgi:hypothetical protein